MKVQVQLRNIQLLPLHISLREIKVYFNSIIFTHVSGEHSFMVDVLSKEGLHSLVGQVIIKQSLEGQVTSQFMIVDFKEEITEMQCSCLWSVSGKVYVLF